MNNELPGEWGRLLGPKGLHSYRDVEARTGISKGTVHRLMNGGPTSHPTVNAIADALFDGDRDLVWSLRGEALSDHGDWQLPPESSLLNGDERRAVNQIIRLFAENKKVGWAIAEQASKDVESAQLRAVATDPSGTSAGNAPEADEVARLARAKQQEAIDEMNRKKAKLSTDE